MEQFIINHIESINCRYIKINNESDLLIIYDLFKNDIIGNNLNSIICLYYGFYYGNIIKDYDLMKKYYLLAIDYHNIDAMVNLAHYYQHIEKNHDLMKKYYLMAIDHDNNKLMHKFAIYYGYSESEPYHDLTESYYLIIINGINSTSMSNSGYNGQKIELDYNLMKKYYFMGIKSGKGNAINQCFKIYQTISQENINDAMYFYNIANISNKQLNGKYNTITKAFNNNYNIANNHITDYMQSMNISILLSKYSDICVSIKQVFMNYKKIMLFLWVVKKASCIIPKHVKLNVISLICV